MGVAALLCRSRLPDASTGVLIRVLLLAYCSAVVIAASTLTYRRIDPEADAQLAVAHHCEACAATYGDGWHPRYEGADRYLQCLRDKVEEFPDGYVLAHLDDGRCVGQMELQVPYGQSVGYVNLFYISPAFRGLGLGRVMHQEYAERYFRSWEADRVELHVSPTNEIAMKFYRRMGYAFVAAEGAHDAPLWRLVKTM
jgi:ribosomal protein S18 acetylase RimI-like enzyme